MYIKDTDVSVGIIDTTTVDEGDWEGCDDHNDSEDSAYIVVASGDSWEDMESREIEKGDIIIETEESGEDSVNTDALLKIILYLYTYTL